MYLAPDVRISEASPSGFTSGQQGEALTSTPGATHFRSDGSARRETEHLDLNPFKYDCVLVLMQMHN